MRNQINLSLNMADKRFDALVKKQEGEHEHIISCHHKEMQNLRDGLSLSMERFSSLFEYCDMQLKDMALFYNEQLLTLKEKLVASEMKISDQGKMIEGLNQQVLDFHSTYSSKITVEKLKKDLALEIKANTISHINSFQDFQREIKILILSLQNDLIKLRDAMDQKLAQVTDKTESNFHISRLDRDGVLKQVRIYEKHMFIIEKKIENIYTLIERLNKRDEICHKPES